MGPDQPQPLVGGRAPSPDHPGLIDCPIHGPSPIDRHHRVPRYQGGPDLEENLEDCCRYCHRDLHRGDYTIHYRGWLGLVHKLRAEGIEVSAYMQSLQDLVREKLGVEAYSERMRLVRRGQSPGRLE